MEIRRRSWGYFGLCASGSRRDQEEGGGAGPPREPRRDQEQGGGARLRKLDNPLLELFLNSCATDSLCDSALQKQLKKQLAVYTSYFAMAKYPLP